MTQNEIIAGAAAVLATLHETGDGMPESTGYLAVGSNLALWDAIASLLKRAGWVEILGGWMTLTKDGAKKAKALAALTAKS